MLLYVGITLFVFILLLIGLRCDAKITADCWPNEPNSLVARSNKRIANAITLCTFTLFWFLTAFRSSNIGNDTKNYIFYFNLFKEGIDRLRTFEIGYQYLNFFIGKITKDPHIFLIIMATIMYGGLILYIFKFSKNTSISLCLFFSSMFSVFLSMLRQGIAMIIVLYGYQFLKEKKKILAALLFLLATTFHTTAIVSFMLFLNVDILKREQFVYVLTLFCGICSINGIFNKVLIIVLQRYAHYFESRYVSTGWLAVSYSLVLYALWYHLIIKSIDENSEQDRLVVSNFTLLLVFAAFGYSVNLFTRAGEYFSLIAIVEIPNMLYRGKVKNYRLWLFALCTLSLIMFVVTLVYRPGWNHIYPYELWSIQ